MKKSKASHVIATFKAEIHVRKNDEEQQAYEQKPDVSDIQTEIVEQAEPIKKETALERKPEHHNITVFKAEVHAPPDETKRHAHKETEQKKLKRSVIRMQTENNEQDELIKIDTELENRTEQHNITTLKTEIRVPTGKKKQHSHPDTEKQKRNDRVIDIQTDNIEQLELIEIKPEFENKFRQQNITVFKAEMHVQTDEGKQQAKAKTERKKSKRYEVQTQTEDNKHEKITRTKIEFEKKLECQKITTYKAQIHVQTGARKHAHTELEWKKQKISESDTQTENSDQEKPKNEQQEHNTFIIGTALMQSKGFRHKRHASDKNLKREIKHPKIEEIEFQDKPKLKAKEGIYKLRTDTKTVEEVAVNIPSYREQTQMRNNLPESSKRNNKLTVGKNINFRDKSQEKYLQENDDNIIGDWEFETPTAAKKSESKRTVTIANYVVRQMRTKNEQADWTTKYEQGSAEKRFKEQQVNTDTDIMRRGKVIVNHEAIESVYWDRYRKYDSKMTHEEREEEKYIPMSKREEEKEKIIREVLKFRMSREDIMTGENLGETPSTSCNWKLRPSQSFDGPKHIKTMPTYVMGNIFKKTKEVYKKFAKCDDAQKETEKIGDQPKDTNGEPVKDKEEDEEIKFYKAARTDKPGDFLLLTEGEGGEGSGLVINPNDVETQVEDSSEEESSSGEDQQEGIQQLSAQEHWERCEKLREEQLLREKAKEEKEAAENDDTQREQQQQDKQEQEKQDQEKQEQSEHIEKKKIPEKKQKCQKQKAKKSESSEETSSKSETSLKTDSSEEISTKPNTSLTKPEEIKTQEKPKASDLDEKRNAALELQNPKPKKPCKKKNQIYQEQTPSVQNIELQQKIFYFPEKSETPVYLGKSSKVKGKMPSVKGILAKLSRKERNTPKSPKAETKKIIDELEKKQVETHLQKQAVPPNLEMAPSPKEYVKDQKSRLPQKNKPPTPPIKPPTSSLPQSREKGSPSAIRKNQLPKPTGEQMFPPPTRNIVPPSSSREQLPPLPSPPEGKEPSSPAPSRKEKLPPPTKKSPTPSRKKGKSQDKTKTPKTKNGDNKVQKKKDTSKLFKEQMNKTLPLDDADEDVYTGLFTTGARRVDLVLVTIANDNEHRENIKLDLLVGLIDMGIIMEPEIGIHPDNQKIMFIKLYAPDDVLHDYAGALRMTKYFRSNHESLIDEKISLLDDKFKLEHESAWLKSVRQRYAAPMRYPCQERSYIVHAMLRHQSAVQGAGLERLLNTRILYDVYALHDGPYYCPQQKEFYTFNCRQVLFLHWAGRENLFKYQPLHMIYEYFGSKLAFYFVFYGFYNMALIFPSIWGLFMTITYLIKDIEYHGFMRKMACNRNLKFGKRKSDQHAYFWSVVACFTCEGESDPYMCPFTAFHERCIDLHIMRFTDSPYIVLYSAGISLWALLFLTFWKRTERYWMWMWEENLNTKLQLFRTIGGTESLKMHGLKQINKTEMNPISYIINVLVSSGAIVLLFIIMLVVVAYIHVGWLKPFTFKYIMSDDSNHRFGIPEVSNKLDVALLILLTSCTVAVLFRLEKMLHGFSWVSTVLEKHLSYERFEKSLISKYFFYSILYSSSLVVCYGWLKGLFHNKLIDVWDARLNITTPWNSFNKENPLRNVTRRAVTLNCPYFSCFREGVIVFFTTILVRDVAVRMIQILTRERIRKDNKSNNKIPQSDTPMTTCEREYRLEPVTEQQVVDDFNTLFLQFALVTLFAPMCPLAPLMVLAINMYDIRSKASMYVMNRRRPVLFRSRGIGYWNHILKLICYATPLCHALTWARTEIFRQITKDEYNEYENTQTARFLHISKDLSSKEYLFMFVIHVQIYFHKIIKRHAEYLETNVDRIYNEAYNRTIFLPFVYTLPDQNVTLERCSNDGHYHYVRENNGISDDWPNQWNFLGENYSLNFPHPMHYQIKYLKVYYILLYILLFAALSVLLWLAVRGCPGPVARRQHRERVLYHLHQHRLTYLRRPPPDDDQPPAPGSKL